MESIIQYKPDNIIYQILFIYPKKMKILWKVYINNSYQLLIILIFFHHLVSMFLR